ncbi:MAG: RNA polymerase sigma-70 factor [Mangrovibacterium sp.]|nr:RNA polymerase sigma-70 factor [Mangrovibacterium sp.]
MPGIQNKIRFENGESVGFEDFFKKNFAIFSSFAFRYIPDPAVCEDIVQEVFLSFWEKRNSFVSPVAAKSFFYISIRNTCLNRIKHEKVKSKYLNYRQPEEETSDSFLEAVFKKEAYREIYQEVNKLPKVARKILKLTLRGRSNEEIANLLGIAVNTVKVHKNRTYKILRRNLRDLYYLFLCCPKPVPDTQPSR